MSGHAQWQRRAGCNNHTQPTWCNSHSWWAIGAEGWTGSRSQSRCPSPCWTGDGTLHSYQYRSTVKENNITAGCLEINKWAIMFHFLKTHILSSLRSSHCCKYYIYYFFTFLFNILFIFPPVPHFSSSDRRHCGKANEDVIPLIRSLGGANS